MADQVRIDTTDMRAAMRHLTAQEQQSLLQRARPVVARHLFQAEGRIKALVSGPVLKVRSGTLRNAVGTDGPHLTQGQLIAHVGVVKESPAQAYAGFLIRGGTITPRRTKYLAIPVGEALTRAGVPKGSPRDFSPTAVFKSRSGNLFIWLVKGRGKSRRVTPIFLLKKSVTIGPHDYLSGPQAELVENVARDVPALVVQQIVENG